MLRKLIKTVVVVIILFFSTRVNGQEYFNSLGLRIGPGPGLTYKVFFNRNSCFEFMLTFPPESIMLTGLYEYHMPVKNTKLLYWYLGCGGHIGFYWDESILGIDLILGLEYKIPDLPISVSLDIKPNFNIIPPGSYYSDFIGLSVRYVFK